MKRFNLRVYGILINDHNEVLLSAERRNGYSFVKFPGGGLEWGESPPDCLRREFREELGIDVEVGELFYLTDFFQQSAFHPDDQLISIYYRVRYAEWASLPVVNPPFSEAGDYETVHWKSLSGLPPDTLTFPIDRYVGALLTS